MSFSIVRHHPSRSIRDLLPACVEVALSDRDLPWGATPRELASVEGAVPARRAEFATGRALAHRALAAAGAPHRDLVRTASGAPAWPVDYVGSITHCSGFRAAAVAARRDVGALGIDAEPHRPLPTGVERLVSTASERREWPQQTGLWPGVVTFSAKEAAYKALAASGSGFLDFLDVRLEFTGLRQLGEKTWSGEFAAHLCVPARSAGLPASVGGSWLVADSLVFTAVVLPSVAEMRWCA